MINTIKLLNENLERKFWDIVIPWMRSEPQVAERLISLGYYFMDRLPKRSFIVQCIFWICIGLSLGLGIGVLLP